jgi:hypothetical protein
LSKLTQVTYTRPRGTQHKFQILMQVCTILLGLVVHNVHRWKLHQVKIPMQETVRLFEFRARSYGPCSGSCTDCFVATQKLQKTFGILHRDDLSHPTRRDVPSIYTPCTPPYEIILIWDFFSTATWHLLLHHSVWVYGGIHIYPLCCIFFVRLYTSLLHRHRVCAPGPFDSRLCGLVSWECCWAVLDSGCHIETVVGSSFTVRWHYLSWLLVASYHGCVFS